VSDILHHTPTETAKIIRADLKRAFPDVKFSVTSRSFANGNAVEVRWELGPGSDEVHALVGQYATERGDYGESGRWEGGKAIEIDTPEGKGLARFVKFVQLHRQRGIGARPH
jgi:hypothetical protein